MASYSLDVERIMTIFGHNLRATRESCCMTQTELAAKTGLQPSAISHFEAGRREPSIRNLTRLCHSLETTPDVLLGYA